MARPKAKAPALRYHISGQSIVTLDGRDFYLGPHDSPKAFARYAVLIGIYQSHGFSIPDDFDQSEFNERTADLLGPVTATRQADAPLLLRHLTAAYSSFAEKRYCNSRTELARIKGVCSDLENADGDALAIEYGPKALQRQRQRWVDSGKSRMYCNRLTNSVIRIFKWAIAEELVEESSWIRLKAIEPLEIGYTEAPDHDPVKPVPIEDVIKTIPELPPVMRDMLRVQVATGMRPSELCAIKPAEIDRTGPVWMYRPAMHKNAKKGKVRAIPIVGDARDAITEYLNRGADQYCFSPAESMAWISAKKRSERKSRVQPSQQNRRKADPKNPPSECYDKHAYRRAIARAAERAKVKPWFPYQIRHLAGTVVRDALGPEAAQALLGHAHINMTEHYAKVTERKAIEAAQHAPSLATKEDKQ